MMVSVIEAKGSWHDKDMDRFAWTSLLTLSLASVSCGGDSAAADDLSETIPCETDADCPPGYVCSGGQECYVPYDPKPPQPCDSHNDCPGSYYCDGSVDCAAADPIELCDEPLVTWSELESGAVFDAGVVDLFVHDFDRDGRDELVARTAKEMQIRLGDELRQLTAFPNPEVASAEQLFVDLDGDDRLDLLARSVLEPGKSWIALGLEGPELGPWQVGPKLELERLVALDWEPGGAPELAGRVIGEPQRPALLTAFLPAPPPTLETFGKSNSPILHVLGGDFDGQPGDELVYGGRCDYTLRTRADWYAHLDSITWTYDTICLVGLGDIDADGDAELVDVEDARGVSLVRVSEGGLPEIAESKRAQLETVRFDLPDSHEELRFLRPLAQGPTMIWFFNAERPKLVRELGVGHYCYELAPPIDPSFARAYGDVDGDGADEIALVDPEGQLHLLDGA